MNAPVANEPTHEFLIKRVDDGAYWGGTEWVDEFSDARGFPSFTEAAHVMRSTAVNARNDSSAMRIVSVPV